MRDQGFGFESLEKLIARDSKLSFTMVLFVAVLVIFLNGVLSLSFVVGVFASVFYFFVGAAFLGRAFFGDEVLLVRFLLGGLVLLVFLGLVGWVVMIVNGLDVWMVTLALFVVAVGCSLSNRVVRRRVRREVA